MHATGTFQVAIQPQTPSPIAADAEVGRMTIDKTWSGDMIGTSKGEMLTGMNPSAGAMAYVAMERMHVTLAGRSGTFLLRHTATMQKDDPASGSMDIAVVKNSGTDSLAGITGSLQIVVAGGEHRYDFTYALPSQP